MFTEERAIWLYDHYLWLEKVLPRRDDKLPTALITPAVECFPNRWRSSEESAVEVFARIRKIMGIADWPCTLYQRPSEKRTAALGESRSTGAAGTFSQAKEGEILISYSEDLLKDPAGYISTVAHELCHYLLAKVTEEPPCTWEHLEPLTDLAVVAEGFGVFAANSHFNTAGYTSGLRQGWGWRKIGYLNEAELGFATAIFCVRNQIDYQLPAKLLKLNPREVFLDALDYVADLEEERRAR